LPTAIGDLLVVADGDALAGIYFPGHWHPPVAGSTGSAVDWRADALVGRLGEELGEYLDGRRTEFDLPLAPTGDEFQLSVWRCCGASPTARRPRTASWPTASAIATSLVAWAVPSGATR
jgi:O6-methylguanine-DNA--protein-cysteine methyltransferase